MSAQAHDDYQDTRQLFVTVKAGNSTVVSVEIIDDSQVEPDEVFFVKMFGDAVGKGINVLEITIEDDDGNFRGVFPYLVLNLKVRIHKRVRRLD